MTMDTLTFDTYFAQTMTTPAMMADHPAPLSSEAAPTTIKMEDLQVPFDAPSPTPSSDLAASQSTPAPTNADGKPAKKRKSWGQVLPEPKTSLPPRKRAKTEDEKEQRRIERVKRNRLAAHNSRERKRQEYELLQAEKDQTEAKLKSYKDQMEKMAAELKFYRTKYPGEAPETFDLSATDFTDTICPAQTSTSIPTPSSMDSMDSPRDSSCQPETPASFEHVASPECDLTQYPAAILCDLQCQSPSVPTLASSQWAPIWAYLALFNITLHSTRSLLSSTTSSTSTSSLKALQPQRWNPLLTWLTLVSISLARPTPASASALTQPFLAFLTASMQSSLTCRVPLARLTAATRLSQRTSSVELIYERSSRGMSKTGPVGGGRSLSLRHMKALKVRQSRNRRNVSTRRTRSLGRENMVSGITRQRTVS